MRRGWINHLAYCQPLTLKRLALGFAVLFNEMGFAATPPQPGEVIVQAEQLGEKAEKSGKATMRSIPSGGSLRVSGVNLDKAQTTDMVLKRFDVFTPDAKVYVNGITPIPVPKTAYFRGSVSTMPQSIVVLMVPEQGPVRGLITNANEVWMLDGNYTTVGSGSPNLKATTVGSGFANRKIDTKTELAGHTFECGTDSLATTQKALSANSTPTNQLDTKLPANVKYTARVAIETDYEYYAIFDDVDDAVDYAGDLIAYASTVYESEINTNLVISYISLWPDGADSDPWTFFASDDSKGSLSLDQLRTYWNANRTNVNRSIVHFLIGKDVGSGFGGGGLAKTGGLCTDDDYGLIRGVVGEFDIDHPTVMWDMKGLAHEIGHGFSSTHTQNYCGIDGVDDPVDLCVNSERDCGSQRGLPGVNSLTGGEPGKGTGTIMSYCQHVKPDRFANLSYTFGVNHPYGRAASRVPKVMRSYVQAQAQAYPGCLDFQSTVNTQVVNSVQLFEDSFEDSGWSVRKIVQTGTTTGVWTFPKTTTNPTISLSDGTKFSKFNSFDAASGNQTRLYQATGFAIANTYASASLVFWMYHDTGYSNKNDRVQVQVSTDNGSTWTNVGAAVSRYATNAGWTKTTIDLSAYKGKTINLGFLGISAYGNNMAIDDVEVVAVK